MRNLLKKLGDTLESVYLTLEFFTVGCIAPFVMLILLVQALLPLSPIITVAFVAILTMRAFKNGDGVLAIAGIAIYGLSWFVVEELGQFTALGVCATGILVWIAAAFNFSGKPWRVSMRAG